jgi:mono/diheme cytochrome c family protein
VPIISLSESECVNSTFENIGTLVTLCLLAPVCVAAQDRSTQDGVFSEDQASSGQETFETVCASCHTPDQFGEAFIQSWAGATIGDMYDLISALMPEDQPGSLEPAQYVAVLSYIFQINGLPTGPDALGEERAVLGSIRVEN